MLIGVYGYGAVGIIRTPNYVFEEDNPMKASMSFEGSNDLCIEALED